MTARRIPLHYIQKGHVVLADGRGGWKPLGDPAAGVLAIKKSFDAAESVYLLDLDGQASGVANLSYFQEIERRRVFPWIDAGCRKVEDAMDILFAGAEALTVQLRHLDGEGLEDVGGLTEADFHIGLQVEAGLDKGMTPKDALEVAERVAATGIVLYEGEKADWYKAMEAAASFHAAGIPTTWVARPGSPHTSRALIDPHILVVVEPETPK